MHMGKESKKGHTIKQSLILKLLEKKSMLASVKFADFCRLCWRPGRTALWEALSPLLFGSPWRHRVCGLPCVQTYLRLSG